MAQPFPDDAFDVAVMPLVIFFVPDPAKGVAEMVRVVCPDGTVTAYTWDMYGGGFPYEVLQVECAHWVLQFRFAVIIHRLSLPKSWKRSISAPKQKTRK